MKTFILIFLVILFCCVNGIRAQGDKIIDMGTYSVRAPKGDDWDIRIEKEKGKVEFSREKGELLSFLSGRIQGATLITVFRNWVGWMRWNKSEEETANHYRATKRK